MSGGGDHRKVGGDADEKAAGSPSRRDEGSNKVISDFLLSASEGDQRQQKRIEETHAHNYKVAQQYYKFRAVLGIVVAIVPLLILGVVLLGLACGWFGGMEKYVVHTALVSGAFISFTVLYGLLLRSVFGAMQDRRMHDGRGHHPHDDMEIESSPSAMPGLKEMFKHFQG